MKTFARVLCTLCERVCLPEHAPEHVVMNLDTGEPSIMRLCRIPMVALADGGFGYTGCGPNNSSTCLRSRVLSDPFLGRKAPPPFVL